MMKLETKAAFARRCRVTAAAVTKQLKGNLKAALVGDRIDYSHPAAIEYVEKMTAPRPPEPAPGVDPLFNDALEVCRRRGVWSPSAVYSAFKIGYARAKRIHAQLAAAGHVPESQRSKPVPATQQAQAPKPERKHGKGKKISWHDESELVEIPDDIESMADLTLRELIDKFGTGLRFLDWLKALKEIEAVNEKRIKNAQSMGKLVSRRLVETGVVDPFNSAHVRLMTDGAKAITSAVLSKHQAGVTSQEIESYVADVVGSFIRPVKSKIERNLASVTKD